MSKVLINFDWKRKLIIIRSPTYEVSAQSLVNSIAEEHYKMYTEDLIAEYTGKQHLTGDGQAPITISLKDDWRITFEIIGNDNKDIPRVCSLVEGAVGREDGKEPFHDCDNLFSQNIISFHQKFNILPASNQLNIDFNRWAPRCDTQGLPLSMCYFNIDNFKKNYNEPYTESLVDQKILKPYQRFLKEVVRPYAAIYSEGGDEFIMLLPGCNLENSRDICKKILASTRQQVFSIDTKEESITISMGLTQRHLKEQFNDVKIRANLLKKKAKEEGRDRLKDGLVV